MSYIIIIYQFINIHPTNDLFMKHLLRIFNLLGQPVAELVNGGQSAGYQSAVWNAAVANGMYFYRMEAAASDDPTTRFIETRKMILLK